MGKKHCKDEDTGIHTIQLWVRKQKDGEDGAFYHLQSKPVQTPDGDSMVLVPIDESDARDLLEGKRQLSKSDVECALKELCRDGGHVNKRTLATHLANRLQISVSGVEKALDRKFKTSEFYNDGRWRLRVFLDGDETFAEQMKAARADYINGRVVDAASGTEIFS